MKYEMEESETGVVNAIIALILHHNNHDLKLHNPTKHTIHARPGRSESQIFIAIKTILHIFHPLYCVHFTIMKPFKEKINLYFG